MPFKSLVNSRKPPVCGVERCQERCYHKCLRCGVLLFQYLLLIIYNKINITFFVFIIVLGFYSYSFFNILLVARSGGISSFVN